MCAVLWCATHEFGVVRWVGQFAFLVVWLLVCVKMWMSARMRDGEVFL